LGRVEVIQRIALRFGYVPVDEAVERMKATVRDNYRLRQDNVELAKDQTALLAQIESQQTAINELLAELKRRR
jgi:hypothetical protein